MKRLLIFIISCILISTQTANASTKLKVTVQEEFKTESPAEYINLVLEDDENLGDYNLKAGDIVECKVIKVKKPKRGKIDARFSVQPISYVNSDGEKTVIKKKYIGTYAKSIITKEDIKRNVTPKSVVKAAAKTAGNMYIKGMGQEISFIKGVVKNKEGNRLKSGFTEVYEDSPLAYTKRGEEVCIEPGDVFYITFKSKKSKETQNVELEQNEDNQENN